MEKKSKEMVGNFDLKMNLIDVQVLNDNHH